MGFLSGRMTFERYRINGTQPRQFGPEHLEILQEYVIGQAPSSEQPDVGFLGGKHLFDCTFDLEKNVYGDALHCAVRIDTHQIPAAIRQAWLQIELAAMAAEHHEGRISKAQRQEAKESVTARCDEEIATGRYRRMQQFPLLWDARNSLLYFGGTSPTASEQCAGLFAAAFDVELEKLTAGKIAQQWAATMKHPAAVDDLMPVSFYAADAATDIGWLSTQTGNRDFLGNEFLLWLWWTWETQGDTLEVADGSEVTGMFGRTLSLECPLGESGKETITALSPVHLPEAALAIRSGKLPRKAGLTLVRHGQQYELALQAETFAVGSAKIQADTEEEGGDREGRIDALRGLSETLDLLFATYCARRVGKNWSRELDQIRRWLQASPAAARKPAA